MSDTEDIPANNHPRMVRPRVSFSGGGAGNGESGRINSGFTIEEDPDSVQSLGTVTEARSNENGRRGNGIVEMEDMEMTEIPMSRLNMRRVSVTAAGDAVVVRGAEKSYISGQPVLNGLNMTVPCGSIYGLLGSSGCGKTTMLSCIVGQRKLDHLNIWIFGEKPGTKSIGVPGRNIGYMPQDISLYGEFSIGETLTYFGTLSGMKKEPLKEARKFLVKLLDLPEEKRRVATLSGGQQRRVSFAAALIHDPELLLLDEPTVGVDPLLRHKIWLHLHQLVCSKRTTVIITTHYIEECRQANNIGLMRSGRLLAERQPNELFAEYNSTNLESIVLRLSRKNTVAKLDPTVLEKAVENSKKKRKRKIVNKVNNENVTEGEEATSPNSGDELDFRMASVMHVPEPTSTDSLARIRALTGKNFVILFRNPFLLFFVLLVAAVMLTMICICLGQDPIRMRFGLVNQEVDQLTVCPNVTRAIGECNVEHMSCQYLMNIPPDTLHMRLYDSEKDALTAVQKGSLWGYIAFPPDFSINLYDRLASGSNVDELTLNVSQITVRLDESNKQISSVIKKTLHDAYENFTKTFLFDCGFDPRQGDPPLLYREPLFGKKDTDFREFLAPGLAPSLIFFYPIITTSIRLIKEKKNGVLDRSIVAGVQTWEILIAYSISEFFVLVLQSLLNYVVLTTYHVASLPQSKAIHMRYRQCLWSWSSSTCSRTLEKTYYYSTAALSE